MINIKNIIILIIAFLKLNLDGSNDIRFYRYHPAIVDTKIKHYIKQKKIATKDSVVSCMFICAGGNIPKRTKNDFCLKYNKTAKNHYQYQETIPALTIKNNGTLIGLVHGYPINLTNLKTNQDDLCCFAKFMKTIHNHSIEDKSLNEQLSTHIQYRIELWFNACMSFFKENTSNQNNEKRYFVIPRIGMNTYAGDYAYEPGKDARIVIDWVYYDVMTNFINSCQKALLDKNVTIVFSLFNKAKDITYKTILQDLINKNIDPDAKYTVFISPSSASMYSEEFMRETHENETLALFLPSTTDESLTSKKKSKTSSEPYMTEETELAKPFFIFLQSGKINNTIGEDEGIDNGLQEAFPHAIAQINAIAESIIKGKFFHD
jgi:hypothetical protein